MTYLLTYFKPRNTLMHTTNDTRSIIWKKRFIGLEQGFPTLFCSRTPKQRNKNWRAPERFILSILNNKYLKIWLKNGLGGVWRTLKDFSRTPGWKFLITWQNLNVQYSTIFSIFREPRKELAEPRLKNTVLE